MPLLSVKYTKGNFEKQEYVDLNSPRYEAMLAEHKDGLVTSLAPDDATAGVAVSIYHVRFKGDEGMRDIAIRFHNDEDTDNIVIDELREHDEVIDDFDVRGYRVIKSRNKNGDCLGVEDFEDIVAPVDRKDANRLIHALRTIGIANGDVYNETLEMLDVETSDDDSDYTYHKDEEDETNAPHYESKYNNQLN